MTVVASWRPEDWRERAKRRLPKPIFDFIDGGSGDESSIRRNRDVFRRVRWIPAVLRAPIHRTSAISLFGQDWKAPIGVAPMGLGNLAWPGTDTGLIRAVSGEGLAYGLSTAASMTIETAQTLMNGKLWFQLYVGEDFAVAERLLHRARSAGVNVVMVTVDAAWPGLRYRDRANGFGQPLWRFPASLCSHALHPRWSLTTLFRGVPAMVNLMQADSRLVGPEATRLFMASMVRTRLDHDLLGRIRDLWPGRLIVKGVLDPDDAVGLQQRGIDGIVVSNHGGRQLGSVIAALEQLPLIRSAVGPDWPLLFDSGIRTGEDVAMALALGADFVLAGRPWLFASAALGPETGPGLYARQLLDELDNILAQTGCHSVADLRDRTHGLSAGRDACN